MKELDLERTVMIILYEVIETGHHIEHDSPAIGCWQEYGHWKKHHGLYYKEDLAKDVQKKLLESLNNNYDFSTTHFGVDVAKIMIHESEIIFHQGQYYHVEDKKLLEINDRIQG